MNSDPLGSPSFVAGIHVFSVATSLLLMGRLDFDSHCTTLLVEIDRPGTLHDQELHQLVAIPSTQLTVLGPVDFQSKGAQVTLMVSLPLGPTISM